MKKTLLALAFVLISAQAFAAVSATETPQIDPVGKPYPKLIVDADSPSRKVLLCASATICTIVVSSLSQNVGQAPGNLSTIIDQYIDYVGPLTLENE